MPDTDSLLYRLLSRFEDPVGLSRPLWRDYSRWDTVVDFDAAKMGGVLGMAARSSIGRLYTDPWFENNWNQAGRVQMYRTSYHVIWPSLTVADQLDRWYKSHPEIDVIPRVIDLEVSNNQPSAIIAQRTWDLSQAVKARDGKRPIIYSRKNLIEAWLVPHWNENMLNDHFWWLAQYLWDRRREHPGPPDRPAKIKESQIVMHQTADKKPPLPGETNRTIADWDRWEIGNETNMHAWIEQIWGGGEPPEEPPDNGDDLFLPIVPVETVRITTGALNVRAEPDANSEDLGELVNGSVVPVVGASGVWKKICGWIHGDYTGPA
jgi:hypothetical protein